MTQEVSTFAFGGGLDTNSPALAMAPGSIMASMNYEVLAEGYGRMQGYERYDGQVLPSQEPCWALTFDNGLPSRPAVGDLIHTDSGATAIVVAIVQEGGNWFNMDAFGKLVLADLTGPINDGDILRTPANPFGNATSDASLVGISGNFSLDEYAAWSALAFDRRRGLIAAVPGTGPVRGVAIFQGILHAWRDDPASGFCRTYRATDAGWVAVPLLTRISFSVGTSEIMEGDTVTGATSGATATVRRVTTTAGEWATLNAAGRIDVSNVAGAFTAGELLKVAGINCATVGATSTVALPAGGTVRTVIHNFYGASNLIRLYGATGAGPAFEMFADGAVSTIPTGMADDRPERVFVIANHLGLTFRGGSIQFSGTGEPQQWQVILGAGEIGFGSDITDVIQSNQTAVAIFGANKIGVLQGNDEANFALDILTEEAGAISGTAQRIARTIYLDERGLRSLDATQAFGNFKTGALSGRFERLIRNKRKSGIAVVGSFISRAKGHYRLVWADGTGVSVYMGGKAPEAAEFSFGEMRPTCFCNGEIGPGEAIFAGAEDGYVYRLDSSNSLDGETITCFMSTPFNHFGNPVLDERFHKVTVELAAPAVANIGLMVQFDYGEGNSPDTEYAIKTAHGGGGSWDTVNWDDFYWSSPVSGHLEYPIDGFGRNASLTFVSQPSAVEDPHILQAYQVFRSRRRFRL